MVIDNQCEPSRTASEIEQVFKRLQSLSRNSDTQIFRSAEEADAAWKLQRIGSDTAARLRAAKFPERHIKQLANMYGPGLKAAEGLRDIAMKDGALVFLIGTRGPGKTQIATWLAWQRLLSGRSCGMYRKALDMWGEIRATWKSGSTEQEEDVIRRFKRASFLVIDEAQERGDTEADRLWCDRMLTHIIDHRYDSFLPTILCANLDRSKYEDTIPYSVRSRVVEAGGIKVCDWPSYRV